MDPPEGWELLPKRQVFSEHVLARAGETNMQYRQKPQPAQHEASFTLDKAQLELSSNI
jgi:hypothetical protein